MKKAAVIALASIAIGLVVIRIFLPDTGEDAGSVGQTPIGKEGQPGQNAATTSSRFRPVENPEVPIVGRQPYDTGITDDQRVQFREDGMNVATEAVQIANRLHSPEGSTEEDLDFIEEILSIYRLSFATNPVAGDNQMVMQSLLGENPGNLVVFPSDHPSLNSKGELVDRWGTPYFFHALSGTEMEIFSAGPDRVFNTADDLQRSARDGQPLTGAEPTPEPDVEP